MKLAFTEQFLWDVYNFLEEAGKIHDEFFLFPSRMMRSLRYSVEVDRLRKKYERKKAKKSFSQFIYYLKKRGYIRVKNLEGKKGILLTQKGAERVLKIALRGKIRKKRTDGKWLMLMFDIPEEKKNLRNLFRKSIQSLGFQLLQKSVWVCPFDVLKETEYLIRRYEIDSWIKIFIIEEIEM